MRTATPLPTCSTTTERGESAASAEISSPRFIGPGCMTMVWAGSFDRREPSRPNRREYSAGEGKKAAPPPVIRSSWMRSIISASIA